MEHSTIIITGGAGFIGSHVVRLFVEKYPSCHIINVDKLTYAGNLANLRDIEDRENYTFVRADICDFEDMLGLMRRYGADGIIHLAAIAMDVTTWYGSSDSSIRNVLFEDIEVDLNETLYSQQIQASDEDRYLWKTDWKPKLIVVNCDRLGPDLGNQVTGKVENFDSYHSLYDGIVFRNIHFAGTIYPEGGSPRNVAAIARL